MEDKLTNYTVSDDALNIMKKLNSMWAKNKTEATTTSEIATAYLCDPTKWTNYLDTNKANYAIGGPSVELLIKSYRETHPLVNPGDKLVNIQKFSSGYKFCYDEMTSDGHIMSEYMGGVYSLMNVEFEDDWVVTDDFNNMYFKSSGDYCWLSSPGYEECGVHTIKNVIGMGVAKNYKFDTPVNHKTYNAQELGYTPLVSLKPGIQLTVE